MKTTIKELKKKIEHLEKTREDYYSKIQSLESESYEYKRKDREEMNLSIVGLRNEVNKYQNEVLNLMEIIRWHINPETAKDPFNCLAQDENMRKR